MEDTWEKANALRDVNSKEAIALYRKVIHQGPSATEEDRRLKEVSIISLGEVLAKEGNVAELSTLLTEIRPVFEQMAKSKIARIVMDVLGLVSRVPKSVGAQIELCTQCVAWAKNEEQSLLRQRLETRLAALYLENEQYSQCIELVQTLLPEVKRFDEKLVLIEIHLVESKVQTALRNLPKARAALTSARTAANAVYCPPLLQADIDLQAGTLHAEEIDYKTAYSYFFEAFEGFHGIINSLSAQKDDPQVQRGAVRSLKYMLLCKLMINSVEDLRALVSGKNALRYAGSDMDAIQAVARAYKARSLRDFESAKAQYPRELGDDPLIRSHLSALEDTLLEQNLSRLIEPFSSVEIAHVAKLIDLPVAKVERKLSQMILDQKLLGILDQGIGILIIYEEQVPDRMYPSALESIVALDKVVDALYSKTKLIRD